MDRNQVQGQRILANNLCPREAISAAYRALPQHPGFDLCGLLQARGLLTQASADFIRSQAQEYLLSASSAGLSADELAALSSSREEDLLGTIRQSDSGSRRVASLQDSSAWLLVPNSTNPSRSAVSPFASGVQLAASAAPTIRSSDRLPALSGGALQEPPAARSTQASSRLASAPNPQDTPSQGIDVSTNDTIVASKPDIPKLIGDYEILRELSRGGMGAVYIAHSLKLKTRVALKTLLTGQLSSSEAIQRFKLEAETTARLNHPNIVRVLDAGEHAGTHFLVMELIDGESLKSRIYREATPLDEKFAARVTLEMAQALAYSHRRAILHRDIKPANILIRREDERALLTDFGLAKDASDSEGGMTATGQMMGTPEYMSPEQANGDFQFVDRRSDIYSLGASLYEMLTRRPPFQSTSLPNLINQVINHEPEAPAKLRPGLSRDLETILLKCLEKDPAARYLSAEALAQDLQSFLDDQPVSARRPSFLERFRRFRRRHQVALQLSMAVILTSLGFSAYIYGWPALKAWQAREAEVLRIQREEALQASISEAKNRLQSSARRVLDELLAPLQQALNQLEPELDEARREQRLGRINKDLAQKSEQLLLDSEAAIQSLSQRAEARLCELVPASDQDLIGESWTLALQNLKQSIDPSGLQAYILYLRAELRMAEGRDKEAARAWSDAYALRPESLGGSMSYAALAELDLSRFDLERAAPVFEALIRHSSPRTRSRAALGLARIALAELRFGEARHWLAQIDKNSLIQSRRELTEWASALGDSFDGVAEVEHEDLIRIKAQRDDALLLCSTRDNQHYQPQAFRLERGRLKLQATGEAFALPIEAVPFGASVGGPRCERFVFQHIAGNHIDQLYFYEWDGKNLRPSTIPPFSMTKFDEQFKDSLNPRLFRRNVLACADFDGNGLPDLLLMHFHDYHKTRLDILWNLQDGRCDAEMLLDGNSEVYEVLTSDLDGDGKDECLLGMGTWSKLGVVAFRGMERDRFHGQTPFETILGRARSLNLLPRKEGQPARILLSANRDEESDIISVFGPNLSPEKSDGIWLIEFDGKTFRPEPLLMLPFKDRFVNDVLSCASLAPCFPQYPKSFVLGVFGRVAGRTYNLVDSGNGLERLIFKDFKASNPFFYDVDGDGDLECVWTNPVRKRSLGPAADRRGIREDIYSLRVWGLKSLAKVDSKPIPSERSEKTAEDSQPYIIALNLMHAGQFEAAREFLKRSLLDPKLDPSHSPPISLLLARIHANQGNPSEARAICDQVIREHKRWSYDAFRPAARYAEQSEDFAAACQYLLDFKERFLLDPLTASEVDGDIERLKSLDQIKPALTINREFLASDGAASLEVIEPWNFRVTGEAIETTSASRVRASFELPLGELQAGSLRLRARFRIPQQGFARDNDLLLIRKAIRPDPNKPGATRIIDEIAFQLKLKCRGGGDDRSYERTAHVWFAEQNVARWDLRFHGDARFDPHALFELELLYEHQSGHIRTRLKTINIDPQDPNFLDLRVDSFLRNRRLEPGLFRLRLANTGEHDNVPATVSKIHWELISLDHADKIQIPPPRQGSVEQAGTLLFLGKPKAALAQLAALAPSQAPERFDDFDAWARFFLPSLLEAEAQAQCQEFEAARATIRRILTISRPAAEVYLSPRFIFLSRILQDLISEILTTGMSPDSILQKVNQINKEGSPWNDAAKRALLYIHALRNEPQLFAVNVDFRYAAGDLVGALRILDPLLQRAPEPVTQSELENQQKLIYLAGLLAYDQRLYKRAIEYWKPIEDKLETNVQFNIAKAFATKNRD